jgi:hypothetical protein
MPLEPKPLLHLEVIRRQARAFNLPDRVGDWQWSMTIISPLSDN